MNDDKITQLYAICADLQGQIIGLKQLISAMRNDHKREQEILKNRINGLEHKETYGSRL